MGTITEFGSVSEAYRGRLAGTGTGGGYGKKYIYDAQLETQSPPSFLPPDIFNWTEETWSEVTNQVTALNSGTEVVPPPPPTTTSTTAVYSVPPSASQLVFTTQPGGGPNGAVWGTQPTVEVEDSSGNINSAPVPVTLSIASQPASGATLSCTGGNTVVASAGLAAFAGCQIVGKAGSYTLSATSYGLSGVTSTSFAITVGAPAQLVFTAVPGGGVNAAAWATQPVVSVEDSGGNVVTASSASITLAIASQPGSGASLGCTTNPVTASSGVATFTGCAITGKAGSYTLGATSGSLSGTSNGFSIAFGPATHLVFTTQPGGGVNAAAWATQPVVSVEDSGGNVVTSSAVSVTLAINTHPSSGGTLGCTNMTVTATAGVATFAGCEITGQSGNYTLSGTSSPLAAGTSASFVLTAGPANKLAFTTEPGGGADASVWATQPVVTVEDASGNLVTSPSYSVTLAIASQPSSGATLSCTSPVTTTAGVATFAGCTITGKAGTYTLSAAATGVAGGTSTAFSVTIGAASQLVFTTQPGGGANAATWATQPVVTVEDPGGNVVTSPSYSVNLAIASQPTSGASLGCTTNPITTSAGIATFAGCKITGATGSYTLGATAGSLSGTSNGFSITVGAATQLVFTTQPGGGANAATWASQPVVKVEDSGGNVVTAPSYSVTLAIASQPTSGAALACTTNPVTTSAGIATFAGCKITGETGSYTLSAAASGVTTATSAALTITAGAASKIVFSTQPGGGANGVAWAAEPVVTVEDASGNVVSSPSYSVTLTIATQPGAGATLTCTTNPLTTSSGVATFAGCQIVGKAGSYTLSAAATGLTGATSSSLTITVGAATQLVFTTQPVGGTHGSTWATQPVVKAEDSGGNVVTTWATSVTLAIATQPGAGATLSCTTNPVVPSAGVATFAGCKITGGSAGTYTVKATSGALTAATSSNFTS